MRFRNSFALVTLLIVNGCLSTQTITRADENFSGLASWYGQEFAGRTTANGEIFDPGLLTAAHRTLPFGTVLEVTNPKNEKSVTVRINDRGPFVGNRIIDLSYAAAAQLDLVSTGVARVELKVVKMGAGEREPPVPLVVNAGAPVRVVTKQTTQTSAAPPPIEFPLPEDVDGMKKAAPADDDVVVEQIEVQEERGGQPVRKQVDADGRTIVKAPAPSIVSPASPAPSSSVVAAPAITEPKHVVQLGAFQSESNANGLADRARTIIRDGVYVERLRELNRVRVGPFKSREAAIEAKEKLETAGIAAIVVTE